MLYQHQMLGSTDARRWLDRHVGGAHSAPLLRGAERGEGDADGALEDEEGDVVGVLGLLEVGPRLFFAKPGRPQSLTPNRLRQRSPARSNPEVELDNAASDGYICYLPEGGSCTCVSLRGKRLRGSETRTRVHLEAGPAEVGLEWLFRGARGEAK